MKRYRSPLLVLLLALALLLSMPFASAEDAEDAADAATDITRGCLFTRDGKNSITFRINNGDLLTSCDLEKGERLTIVSKTKDAPLGALCLYFNGLPESYVLEQYGADGALLLEETASPVYPFAIVPLEDGCTRAVLRSDAAALSICEATVYGSGTLPADLPVWEPPVERTDFLIVTTHPDDEWIFLGAVYPIYAGQRGLTGTVAYVTTPSYGRLHEALNGMWRGGARTYPFFLGFPDIGRPAPENAAERFPQEDITLALARLYRQIKPLVIVTQDPIQGEYGHWQHIVAANAAIDAATLCADPAYDPASAAEYGVWQPYKVYAHMYPENTVTLDVETPLDAYGGKTALEVARYAYKAHVSQSIYAFYPAADDRMNGDVRLFGLVHTEVGSDTGADLFENIDASLLAESIRNATPTPTLTASPSPTPAVTETPPPSPAATEAPVAPETKDQSVFPVAAALTGAVCLVVTGAVVLLICKRRKRRKRR